MYDQKEKVIEHLTQKHGAKAMSGVTRAGTVIERALNSHRPLEELAHGNMHPDDVQAFCDASRDAFKTLNIDHQIDDDYIDSKFIDEATRRIGGCLIPHPENPTERVNAFEAYPYKQWVEVLKKKEFKDNGKVLLSDLLKQAFPKLPDEQKHFMIKAIKGGLTREKLDEFNKKRW